ncbi:MAG TPA: phosphonoacetaldehyde hydrolase [Acidimicrobiales bacterium]|jgi:phosphonoacetaldehyde hydrolase|nr:phosphonoacetaldehyde hydrolase [Acidimicrobiales bacterium]MDP6214800.1 phosphonoacetaldehyde hydrolase [Acidimicrobiales bacterium]MDP7209754.1 phosphonoacetaldehyde hydrolase [Acidimicrobiales bacterium]HJL89276.1 phosphonoacetaldehyde hydrolase [Acidimicrobiales bacterium]HJO98513.1 phosphonoacetaldehyde hydrolase [Acidimicrobiales bacterium]|tara:strand:- start:36162 stop:37001 length:840 start_codon:yes stop_codon:yes gene_type:complete
MDRPAARSYRGPVRGVVLDWSGTTVDAYVIAPAIVFVEVFHNQGVEISMEEARGPMGLRKDLHIAALTELPAVRERWFAVHGRHPDQADVAAMFEDFVPRQVECLPRYAKLLPGVAEMAERLRGDHDIRIGVTTGFTRPMVEVLLEHAAEQGFRPDCAVAGDDVEHGARPRPFMVYRNMDLLDVHPVQAVVKVDDTGSGVGEGVEAGCWAVGIARYSNYLNINSMQEAAEMSAAELAERLAFTREQLWKAGAHYVIDEPMELTAVIEEINTRLAVGDSP